MIKRTKTGGAGSEFVYYLKHGKYDGDYTIRQLLDMPEAQDITRAALQERIARTKRDKKCPMRNLWECVTFDKLDMRERRALDELRLHGRPNILETTDKNWLKLMQLMPVGSLAGTVR